MASDGDDAPAGVPLPHAPRAARWRVPEFARRALEEDTGDASAQSVVETEGSDAEAHSSMEM